MYYATINDNGRVIGLSQLKGSVSNPKMIEIASYDASLMGQKWNGTSFEVDPAYEAEQAAAIAAAQAREQAFLDNLPSWSQVDAAVTNIANLADAKVFIRKLARVVYWLARNKAE